MKNLNILLSIPRTILFNFRYLPFSQAIKLPVWIAYNCKVLLKPGGVILTRQPNFAMIRIGYHKVPLMEPHSKTLLAVERGGTLIFDGSAHIGKGSKIYVAKNANLKLGDNFAISASTQISCHKSIQFGKDIQFSWDCLVMDSDSHRIYDNGSQINADKEIVFGDKIWIGCRSTVLKGAVIPDGCVIGATSCVTGNKFEPYTIIAGTPAKSIKKISSWEL